jgi:type IV pilus assembly protein PilA
MGIARWLIAAYFRTRINTSGALAMRETLQKGFTLIELMIVVAIIGILASVAIPAYQDYIARAQVSEAVSLLSAGKMSLAEYFGDKTAWPSAAGEVYGTLSGKYTATIAILASATTGGGALTIEATMKTSGVNTAITSGTVGLMTTDGGKNWNCTSAGTTLALSGKYLPGVCR